VNETSIDQTRRSGSGLVLLTLASAQFLMTLDTSVMNVSIATVAKDVGTTVTGIQLAITMYTLVMAAFMITGGKIGQILGRKRAFMIGCVIYGCGSFTTAISGSLGVLLFGWSLLEGLGAVMIMPAVVALVATNFGPPERPRAYGLVASAGAIAVAVGPLVGGLFTTYASWRWVFLVNLPFSVVALVFGVRLLHEVRDPGARRADLLGAGLLSVSVASLVAGIVEGHDWGWTSARILGVFAVAVASGAWLVARSRHHPSPVIEPAVIRHRAVALADASSLVFFGGFGALVLGGVLFLTGVWHESVLRAGFMIAPGPLMAGLTAFPGGVLGARFGHRAVGTVGSLLFAAGGVFWVTHLGTSPDWLGAYLPGSVLTGVGVGLMLPSLGGAATAPLPPERFATGTALYAMTRQIGVALGVAGLVAILGTTSGPDLTAFHHAWIFMIACSLAAGLVLQGVGARAKETADAGAVPLDEGRPAVSVTPVTPVAHVVPSAPVVPAGAAVGCATTP